VGIEQLTRASVVRASIVSLGLDPDLVDLDSPEALAAALRRVASMRCPIGSRALLDATASVLSGLTNSDGLRGRLSELLRELVAYGDLVEVSPDNGGGRLLYLAPPAFVQTLRGTFVLLGIRPEGAPLLDDSLLPSIRYERHTRTLVAKDQTSMAASLRVTGLQEMNASRWLRAPSECAPVDLVAEIDRRLHSSGDSGDAVGLQLLDPATPVRYYRGRWRPPRSNDQGKFVARREQAYGSDLWSYVQVEGGSTTRVVDLPIQAHSIRGCDEAWRLQAAIDARLGHQQIFRIEQGHGDGKVLSLFAPPPSWLQRRWDGRGLPVNSRGALVSYLFEADEVEAEVDFVRRMLWLEESPND